MLKHLLPLAIAAATVALPITTHAQQGEPMTKDQRDVLAVVERMTSAFQQGDIDQVMASYETSAAVLFEPGTPVSEPAALRQMFEAFSAMSPNFTYSGHEVVVAGDVAVHFAPWTMTGTSPEGQKIEQNGLSVAVMRKQPDGRWLMVIDNPHGQRLMQN